MVAVSSYHRMPIAQKRAEALARARSAATRCRECGMQVMPVDLRAHKERCDGRPEPAAGDKWLTHREAVAEGVSKQTLSDWVDAGDVRTRAGDDGYRRYLQRDLLELLVYPKRKRRR